MSNNNMREIGYAFVNHAGEFQFTYDCLSDGTYPKGCFLVYATEECFKKACDSARELHDASNACKFPVEQAEQEPVKRFTSDDVKVAFENGYAAGVSVAGVAKEAAEQEPVGRWNWNEAKFEWLTKFDYHKHHMTPLYAAPVQQAEQEPVGHVLSDGTICWDKWRPAAGTLLYAAPVQQAEQEPVAVYLGHTASMGNVFRLEKQIPVGTKLYAAPVRTKDLTDDEICAVLQPSGRYREETIIDARAVIAKLREKERQK